MTQIFKTSAALLASLALLSFSSGISPAADRSTKPQVIEIHAQKFAYLPAEIELHKGQTYLLHLTSDDVPHSFRIKALSLSAKMEPHQYTDVLFTPQQTGDFRVDCGIYCGAGHTKMSMTVHVRGN